MSSLTKGLIRVSMMDVEAKGPNRGEEDVSITNQIMTWLIYIVSVLLIVVTMPFSLFMCIKMVQVMTMAGWHPLI